MPIQKRKDGFSVNELMTSFTLSHVCDYHKALIIPGMPDDFVVAERFRNGLTDEEIRKGFIAFREFLYNFYDRLSENRNNIDAITGIKYDPYGDTSDNGNGNINHCFPIFRDIAYTLFALGIFGRLDKSEMKLNLNGKDMLAPICPMTEKYPKKYNMILRMNVGRKCEVFQLLSDLGLNFTGVNSTKDIDFSQIDAFNVSSDINNFLVIGLKLIAEATANNSAYYKMTNMFWPVLLKCDFYPLANAKPKKYTARLKECISPQQPEVKEWIMKIDRYMKSNACKLSHSGDGKEFTYTLKDLGIHKGRVFKIHLDILGCFASPGIDHIKNPNNILNYLTDEIIEMMKDERNSTHGSCGQCRHAETALNSCKTGGPLLFSHNGETICRCRRIDVKIPLHKADYRALVEKWVVMEVENSVHQISYRAGNAL